MDLDPAWARAAVDEAAEYLARAPGPTDPNNDESPRLAWAEATRLLAAYRAVEGEEERPEA